MNTVDRIVSILKRNPDLADPIADILTLVDRCIDTPPDSWRSIERDLLEAARSFSCAAQQAVLQTFDTHAPEPFLLHGVKRHAKLTHRRFQEMGSSMRPGLSNPERRFSRKR